MSIRCASKAIIIENGAILMNKCKREDGSVYYDLPGGGQKVYESLEQAVVREVKEETGYDVQVERFVALAEEIYTSNHLREKYPEYTHRIFHIFKVNIVGEKKDAPTEMDLGMEESVWVSLNDMEHIMETCPSSLKKVFNNCEKEDIPLYLGTEYKDWD